MSDALDDGRLLTPAKREADAFEATIRPQHLGDFVGQEQARANLRVALTGYIHMDGEAVGEPVEEDEA